MLKRRGGLFRTYIGLCRSSTTQPKNGEVQDRSRNDAPLKTAPCPGARGAAADACVQHRLRKHFRDRRHPPRSSCYTSGSASGCCCRCVHHLFPLGSRVWPIPPATARVSGAPLLPKTSISPSSLLFFKLVEHIRSWRSSLCLGE